jgi:hypothetical protein
MHKRVSLCAAVVIAAITAPAAGATVSITSFKLTPSTTRAGANPSLTIAATLKPSAGDDPQSVTTALAAGLLANPTVPVQCTDTALQSNTCPSTSLVGTGKVTASAGGLTFSSAARLYLVTPQTGEAGRLALVSSTPLGRIVVQGPVTIRTQPDVGADVTFSNLPKSVGGTHVTIRGLQLTINGTVDGKPFTRNPTSCGPATTRLVVASYGAPSAPVSSSSSFTPTACAQLPFAPALAGSAVVGSYSGDTALTSTITQASGQAATQQVRLTLPFGLLPRSDASSRACTASDPSTCPASATVGSATVDTPMSRQPLSGRVVLIAAPNGGTPGTAIVFGAPFGITLTGTSSTSASGQLVTTYSNMPDVPLSSVSVTLNGGSDSLLVDGGTLCFGSPKLTAAFTGHNGATASSTAPLAVSGC